MILSSNPRISPSTNWTQGQRDDLKAMQTDISRAIATQYPQVVQTVTFPTQKTDIAGTAFQGVVIPGLYRVSMNIECTTSAGGAGTVTPSVAFTDDVGLTSVSTTALSLTATGRQSGQFFIRSLSGFISYSTAHTGSYSTAVYSLYIVLERLA